jgi:hypothetical protein
VKKTYIRTVRNNEVRILGHVLVSKELNNHELDGKRFAFMPYRNLDKTSGFDANGLTALWGTEKLYRASLESEDAYSKECEEGEKLLAPDGKIRWYFWHDKVTNK